MFLPGCDIVSGPRQTGRIMRTRKFITGALASLALVVASSGVASAHYGHSGKSCGTNYSVTITSKSAGQTWHQKKVGSILSYYDHGYVYPSNPTRNWRTGNQSVTQWGASAPVLESHSANCFSNPV